MLNSFGANGSMWRQITNAGGEQKRLRCFVRLLIKDFKYGSSLILLTEKIIMRRTVKRPLIFHCDNNTTAEFDSGLNQQEIEGKNTV